MGSSPRLPRPWSTSTVDAVAGIMLTATNAVTRIVSTATNVEDELTFKTVDDVAWTASHRNF